MFIRRCLAVAASFIALAAHAGAAPTTFNIAAQPLAKALIQFSEQSKVVVMAPATLLDGKQSPAVVGEMAPLQALEKLLEGSGLASKIDGKGTVLILAPANAGQASVREQLRLVSRGAAEPQSPAAAPRTDERAPADAADLGRGIPEMLVEGKRSINSDIHRTEDDVQPYVVFDAETLERSLATNLEDFLKSRLPMNAIATTNSQQPELAGNTSSIDLRGLGTDETLILVNGRRLPGVSNLNRGGAIGQADINGIPISAVERIEVLPSTASGIYGGGATGGVVNIILKSDYNNFELTATYDNTFDSDAGSREISGVAGFNLESGRTAILLTGSYSDGNGLVVGDRDFVERGYDLYVRNTHDDFTGGFQPPLASTTNIHAEDFSELMLIDPNGGPPIPLGSMVAHVPTGYAGIQSDGGAALIATGGSYNIELPRDIQGLDAGLLNTPVVESLGASIRRKFTDRVEGFLDLSWTHNEGHARFASDLGSLYLLPGGTPTEDDPYHSPGNPFVNDVTITFPLPGLAFDSVFTSENRSARGGLIVRLPHDWYSQAEYGWGRSRVEGTSTYPIISFDAQVAIDAGELDVFRDLNIYRPDYAAGNYLLDSPNNFMGPFDNTFRDGTFRLAGPLHDLPGGPITLSAFYEYRKSEAAAGITRLQDAFDRSYFRLYYADRSDRVNSVALESTAPIFSPRNARPGVHALDLQASVRYDDYRINGVVTDAVTLYDGDPIPELDRVSIGRDSTDYTVGLRYAPSADIVFRVSYGTGFLPPTVAQITPVVEVRDAFLSDPKRGGAFTRVRNVRQTRGGNPLIDPEISTSTSAGVILTPRMLPGLRVSVDYTEIRKTGEIASIDLSTILADETNFGDRIVRADLTSADILRGFTGGEIREIDLSLLNLSRTTVRAYDMQLDYRFKTPLGDLRTYAMASYMQDYVTQYRATTPAIDRAGYIYPLKWRGNAGFTLQRERLSFDWNMQYFGSYYIYPAGLPPQALPQFTIPQGSGTIPRQMYHDLTARFSLDGANRFAGGIFANTEIQVGIRNVFNTSPPIVATQYPSDGYSFYGDPRLRRYSVSLRKRFR